MPLKKYKNVVVEGEEFAYYIALETQDAKSVYRSICKASKKYNTSIIPMYDPPIFSDYKQVYVLCFEDFYGDTGMSVMTSDTLMHMILNNIVVEY